MMPLSPLVEKPEITLGYIPLTDCLPLVVARECGFFAEEGLRVTLSREASWANIRDKLIVGHLDAAQLLAPMLLAASLGMGGLRKPMLTAFSLGLNGNAITVSNALFDQLRRYTQGGSGALVAAKALREVIRLRRHAGLEPLVFAAVFRYSCHYYQLRYWMEAGGIDTERDVRIVVLPPTQMVENLRLKHIDGYCVGEPWNSVAVRLGIGRCLVSGYEIWQNAPEKVLGVTADWQERFPGTHAALLRALYHAAQWSESHREEAIALLCGAAYLDLPRGWVTPSLTGALACGLDQKPREAYEFNVFHRYQANFPWRSHAEWLLRQMQRWHQPESAIDIPATAAGCWRTDLYREALADLAVLPMADSKPAGEHFRSWMLGSGSEATEIGPDLLIDGARW